MTARRIDLVAFAFLFSAWLSFVLSLVLVEFEWNDPFSSGEWERQRGYEAWLELFKHFHELSTEPFFIFLTAGSILSAVVAFVSPFLFIPLRKSRPLWWLVLTCSILAVAVAVVGKVWISYQNVDHYLPDYSFCLGAYLGLSVPYLNFVGLLLVRPMALGGFESEKVSSP